MVVRLGADQESGCEGSCLSSSNFWLQFGPEPKAHYAMVLGLGADERSSCEGSGLFSSHSWLQFGPEHNSYCAMAVRFRASQKQSCKGSSQLSPNSWPQYRAEFEAHRPMVARPGVGQDSSGEGSWLPCCNSFSQHWGELETQSAMAFGDRAFPRQLAHAVASSPTTLSLSLEKNIEKKSKLILSCLTREDLVRQLASSLHIFNYKYKRLEERLTTLALQNKTSRLGSAMTLSDENFARRYMI